MSEKGPNRIEGNRFVDLYASTREVVLSLPPETPALALTLLGNDLSIPEEWKEFRNGLTLPQKRSLGMALRFILDPNVVRLTLADRNKFINLKTSLSAGPDTREFIREVFLDSTA